MVVIIRRALVVVVVTVLVTFFDVPYANAELSFLPFLSAWGGITRYCDDLLFVALLYFYRIVKNFRRTNDVDSDHDDFDDNCAKNCPPFDLNVSSRAVVVVVSYTAPTNPLKGPSHHILLRLPPIASSMT